MKRILKHQLSVVDTQEINVPKGTKFLSAQEQNHVLCVWYECEDQNEIVSRRILIAVTGGPSKSDQADYLATVLLDGGGYVAHVFVCPEG